MTARGRALTLLLVLDALIAGCGILLPPIKKPPTEVSSIPNDRADREPGSDLKLPAPQNKPDLPPGVVPNRVDVPDYEPTVIRFGRTEVTDVLTPPHGHKTHSVWPVVIFKDDLSPSSDKVFGNGILIGRDVVLTARHVAKQVELAPGRYRLELYAQQDSTIQKREVLEYGGVTTLGSSDDPDLACIRLKSPTAVQPDSLPITGALHVRGSVYVIGAGLFGDVPRLGLGNLFAPVARRCLGLWCITVAGTNLFRFEGLSGSAVFNRADGSLLGVLVAGDKEMRPYGEKVTRAPTDSTAWAKFDGWTWVTPVYPWSEEINRIVRGSR
jgi:hypothetical protein